MDPTGKIICSEAKTSNNNSQALINCKVDKLSAFIRPVSQLQATGYITHQSKVTQVFTFYSNVTLQAIYTYSLEAYICIAITIVLKLKITLFQKISPRKEIVQNKYFYF